MASGHGKMKCFFALCLLLALFIAIWVCGRFNVDVISYGPIPSAKNMEIDIPCDYALDLSREEIMERVSSYRFLRVQDYIQELFPKQQNRSLPQDPIFVSGFSSNHSREGLAMIYNFSKSININNNKVLIIYDIGLTGGELRKLKTKCSGTCKVRRFPFHAFPDHVGILKGYAWKPLIIQLVAKEHPFVVWIDTSIRFRTDNIDPVIQKVKRLGVMVRRGVSQIAGHTSEEMFRFLNEPPCLYKRLIMAGAGFVCVYQTPFIMKYFMIPWVSCALARGCMVPTHNVYELRNCSGVNRLFGCHRFEQSMIAILLHRLFQENVEEHFISLDYYLVCRGCTKKG